MASARRRRRPTNFLFSSIAGIGKFYSALLEIVRACVRHMSAPRMFVTRMSVPACARNACIVRYIRSGSTQYAPGSA